MTNDKKKTTKPRKPKLPPANDWQAREITDWNVTTFHAYLIDLHAELFGCEYAPMRSWTVEKGLLGTVIGTQRKKGTHDKALVKAFIDETFHSYRPTRDYPGTSFGFMWAYRKNVLQRLESEQSRKVDEETRKANIDEFVTAQKDALKDLTDWF